jgi:glutathione synthase/RimK-type ligase-like ATP-grasp enzyme
MDKTTYFDVLIIYSDRMAKSANSQSGEVLAPFCKEWGNESYNLVYGYFLEMCNRYKLKAAFSTSADIIGAGKCKGYWIYENSVWMKVRNTCYSKLIFDKFSPTNINIRNMRKLVFSSRSIKPFNDPYLFELFFDKQKTHDKFAKFSIPTTTIKGHSKKAVEYALSVIQKKIANHKQSVDFSDGVVMKNRFGAGGRDVYKYKNDDSGKILETLNKRSKINFILQPFVKFNKGFSVSGPPATTDIRLIYSGEKIIQTYTRTAKKGDFKCNEHAGGTLKYISIDEVPVSVTAFSKEIINSLKKSSSLFALDFIVTNAGNVYLLEANTGPGLDWNLSVKENEIEAKKLIRIIVKDLAKRTRRFKGTFNKKHTTRKYRNNSELYLNAATY